jgi:hypothetical protein
VNPCFHKFLSAREKNIEQFIKKNIEAIEKGTWIAI